VPDWGRPLICCARSSFDIAVAVDVAVDTFVAF
jgi:hypothetical protein